MTTKYTAISYECDACGNEIKNPEKITNYMLDSMWHVNGRWAIHNFDFCGSCWDLGNGEPFIALIKKAIAFRESKIEKRYSISGVEN